MKRVAVVVMIAMLLAPGVALAGSSTDAALGLGAFAVFNQIISGTGIFGRPAPVVVHQPVVVAPPPVVVMPAPVVYAPAPVIVYPAPAYYRTYVQYVPAYPGWVPPGHLRHGHSYGHWRHHDDD
jgi:hypothetical protein